jgi:hypothetical protein
VLTEFADGIGGFILQIVELYGRRLHDNVPVTLQASKEESMGGRMGLPASTQETKNKKQKTKTKNKKQKKKKTTGTWRRMMGRTARLAAKVARALIPLIRSYRSMGVSSAAR